MRIKNVKVYRPDHTFQMGEIRIKEKWIDAVLPEGTEEDKKEKETGIDMAADADATQEMVLDGDGCYAIPGLIDLHFHGCMGYDACDGTEEALREIARYEASIGVTAIAPATMTLPVDELERVLEVAASYKAGEKERQDQECYADLLGLNMEGPFISPVKKGAQDARNIIVCDAEVCRRFLKASDGLVKIVGIAPEESADALAFIREMKDQVILSLAHTNADYDTALAACEAGVSHVVHLYNAMSSFSHREPGVVGAAADSAQVTAELICDGVHVHPSAVRAAFRLFGADRMILISDSMRAAGMPDGRYLLGGLEVEVIGSHAVLVSDGALAGSVTNLMDCMRHAVQQMQLPLETAVACASENPAKKLGVYAQYGSIESGKHANLVLLDEELKVKAVIKDGKVIVS